jgi:uncharacterized protein
MTMKRIVKRALAAVILVLSVAAPVAAGQLEDGLAAADNGDYATAIRLWRPLAEQGDAAAQFNLGLIYYKGQGVPQDYVAAAVWLRKAADQGVAAAQWSIGSMYANGRGVRQDYAAAVSWYRKAADKGDANAQANLGGMYAEGHGVPQDYVLAHMWLNLAAAKGNKSGEIGRDMAAARMTPAQIAEAQKRAREWKPK